SSAASKRLPRSIPAVTSTMRLSTAADSASRNEREFSLNGLSRIIRFGDAISHAADGMEDVDAEFLAQPPDKHFDGVRAAVEILVVEMLDQFGARHDLALVVHQLGEQAKLERGQLDGIAIDRDAGALGVEQQRPAADFARTMTGAPGPKGTHE